jgi:hypothetical protein
MMASNFKDTFSIQANGLEAHVHHVVPVGSRRLQPNAVCV